MATATDQGASVDTVVFLFLLYGARFPRWSWGNIVVSSSESPPKGDKHTVEAQFEISLPPHQGGRFSRFPDTVCAAAFGFGFYFVLI